jgi:rRNA processing protein Gar1
VDVGHEFFDLSCRVQSKYWIEARKKERKERKKEREKDRKKLRKLQCERKVSNKNYT